LLVRKRLAKGHPSEFGRPPMSGIYMILVFLAVMAALNRFEFGRFD
jgi:ribose/xylose/arabinose/galactoside ABC-type transport system permease subunit